jgi:hypothetical protein
MDKKLYDKMIKEIEKKYSRLNPNKSVGIPVPILIQESENLFHWCRPDKAVLKKNGLDWELVKDIPDRVRLVQELEAQWFIARKTRNKIRKNYLDAMKKCRELCAELVRDFKFALGGRAKTSNVLSNFKKYRKNIDVVVDLFALAEFGRKNTPLLNQINFDLSVLNKANAMAKDLSGKTGENTADTDKYKLQSTYQKACFYLKDAVSEVRRCGKYVFHGDKERLIGYRSEYRRLHKGKKVVEE